jgi:hypothetical protein
MVKILGQCGKPLFSRFYPWMRLTVRKYCWGFIVLGLGTVGKKRTGLSTHHHEAMPADSSSCAVLSG